MKLRSMVSLGVAAAALAFSTSAGAVLINGSFEDGPAVGGFTTVPGGSTAIDGWTVGGHSVDYIGSYWPAQDGSFSIDLAGNGLGTISQTFATEVGQGYQVNFWVGRNPDGGTNPRTGFANVGGGDIAISYSGSGTRANMQWQKEGFSFIANDVSTTLTFGADNSANGFYGLALDNVSVAAVPEPTTWAMMILGFGAVGGAMRQSRRRRALLPA